MLQGFRCLGKLAARFELETITVAPIRLHLCGVNWCLFIISRPKPFDFLQEIDGSEFLSCKESTYRTFNHSEVSKACHKLCASARPD